MHYLKKMLLGFIVSSTFIFCNGLNVFAIDVIPGGETIGITIQAKNITITGTYDVEVGDKVYNPKNNDIQRGDKLLAVNNVAIDDISNLLKVIQNSIDNSRQLSQITVSLLRNGNTIERKLDVYYNSEENNFKTGLYVTDKVSGIGTVTFYNPENNTYGSLGHEMTDMLSQDIIEIRGGDIYESDVVNISPSLPGNPGEKIAQIDQNKKIGDVIINNKFGVYGKYTTLPNSTVKSIPIATMEEVEKGIAEIWTVIDKDKVEIFTIEITDINIQKTKDTKGITFKVIDEKLLQKTNGIIQGMSGSPIIQNGKLIGAVTHVKVDKVDCGYGIFIEWMFSETQAIN